MENLQINLLFQAAAKGSVNSLKQLIKDDPSILIRARAGPSNQTLLHVAAIRGHVKFVKEIMRMKPELLDVVNSKQSTALHMAAAMGHVEVVKALLSASRGACLALDIDKLTPLHLAAARGHVAVVKLLLEAEADAAYRGESILHLYVKQNQVEALEVVVKGLGCEEGFINSVDEHNGNVVLHLALEDNQVETLRFFLSVAIQVNTVNEDGMTVLDVLIRSKRDVRDSQIENSLKKAGGQTVTFNNNKRVGRHLLEHMTSSFMVVLVSFVLFLTIAFQVRVNPLTNRGWQDDHATNAGGNVWNSDIVNMVLFIFFVSIILLLMRKLLFRWRFFVWILKVLAYIAGTIFVLWYVCMLILWTPGSKYGIVYVIGLIVIMSFVLLVAVIVLIIRMASWIVAWIVTRTIRLIVELVRRTREH